MSEAKRQTKTVMFAGGSCEKALHALGFDEQTYLCGRADDFGGIIELKTITAQYEHLASLLRPKLFAEIVNRMTLEEWN